MPIVVCKMKVTVLALPGSCKIKLEDIRARAAQVLRMQKDQSLSPRPRDFFWGVTQGWVQTLQSQ